MATVAIVSQKGGSGKTTLALHLAVAATAHRRTTRIIDADPQASAAAWGDWREGAEPEVVTCPPARLGRTVQTMTKAGADLIVIDTPPHADAAAREAAKIADLILVPTRPRSFDLQALQATAEIVDYARKPAFVFLNSVPPRATRITAHATEFAEALGLQICPVRFGERGAFHHYAAAGSVASEMHPDGAASAEVAELWRWVCKQFGWKASGK